jgi:hypothetical protein
MMEDKRLPPADAGRLKPGVGRPVPKRSSVGTLTPEQRSRLISSGPNAGRVRRDAGALTDEARRYCHGDDAWTHWQPCTAEQAARYEKDDAFNVRPLKTPNVRANRAEAARPRSG